MPNRQNASEVLAKNLTELMDVRGIAAVDLEPKSGVSDSTINNFRNAKGAARIDKIEALAQAFNLPTWAMLIPNLDPNTDGRKLNQLIAGYLSSSPDNRTALALQAQFAASQADSSGEY